MKYIKKFELNTNIPEIGDYILTVYDIKNDRNTSINQLKKFIDNTIGIVVDDLEFGVHNNYVRVKYENIPENIKNFFIDDRKRFNIVSIVDYDKDLETLKYKIEANKFNI